MKKKIIKFYFFRKKLYDPAISYVFCFSKKFVKHKKKLTRFFSNYKINFKKNLNLYDHFFVDKKFKKKVIFNQWESINRNLNFFFYNSFFIAHKYKAVKTIKLWFYFSKKSKKLLLNQLFNVHFNGVISAHFIHFLLNKNLIYQIKSKYNTHIFNHHILCVYMNLYTKILYNYISYNEMEIYNITSALNKLYMSTDENFNVIISNWSSTGFHRALVKNYTIPYVMFISHCKVNKYDAFNYEPQLLSINNITYVPFFLKNILYTYTDLYKYM